MLQYNIHVNSSELEKTCFFFVCFWFVAKIFSGRWITESIWTPSNLLLMLD